MQKETTIELESGIVKAMMKKRYVQRKPGAGLSAMYSILGLPVLPGN